MERDKAIAAEKKGTNEVVLVISNTQQEEDGFFSLDKNAPVESFLRNGYKDSSSNLQLTERESIKSNRVQVSNFATTSSSVSCSSPEITKSSGSPNKPPKVPIEPPPIVRRRSLVRSAYSKPKSRLVEPTTYSVESKSVEETTASTTQMKSPNRNSPSLASPNNNKVTVLMSPNAKSTTPVTPKTPLIGSPDVDDQEDDEEVYKTAILEETEKSAWVLLINRGVKRTKHTTKILNYVTKVLGSFLIGAAIWMLKTILVKFVASKFHVTRFFDRIQESIFHQYVLRTLSGPPLMDTAEEIGSSKKGSGQLSFRKSKKGKGQEKEDVIDVEKLHKIKQEKVSAWTMKGLIKVIRSTGLSTISDGLEDSDYDGVGEQKDKQITSEMEAKTAAYLIFKNVAKPSSKHIVEEDLLRFMKKEDVDNVFPMFEGAAETKKIKKAALRNWVVSVYVERKALSHSLNDTKTAIEELNRILSVIVVLVFLIVTLLVLGLLTTKVLVVISSQLLLVVFVFGNSAKTAFEAIIFVFMMHPFDVGDRCVIDGVQMVVEEMNILTTVFLRYDNEKIFYPNSVLSTKPISNFYRSPAMGDSVEFAIDVSTSFETIGALKARIKGYLESKPQHWQPSHSVIVKEIEDMNKMKMALYVTHTINFQNTDRGNRRSDLLLELKKIFEELGIKYHLLPQKVEISYSGSTAPAFPTIAR